MTPGARRQLAQAALAKSLDVRSCHDLRVDTRVPIDIYEVCAALGISIRSVGINMEGMYVRNPPQILVSALRPYPRRTFTCAHELGHHVFGHGSTIDELVEGAGSNRRPDAKEILVQLFAGHLLLPVLGVRSAFASRGWDAKSASPAELLTIACSFGVSYEALVTHLASSLNMLPERRARELRRVPLPKVRETLTGTASSAPLLVVDQYWSLPTVDTEVGTDILLPTGSQVRGAAPVLELTGHAGQCPVFRASKPGSRTVDFLIQGQPSTLLLRVARYQYVGLSRYRFLEAQDDWDCEEEDTWQ